MRGNVAATDWEHVRAELDRYGCALTGPLLTPKEAEDITSLYKDDARFRATIDMARHRFGSGQYRYFTHDLPEPLRAVREAFYPHLLVIARAWAERLGRPAPWPDTGGVAGAVPPGRAVQELADPAALPGRGLERPAPRPVRRPGIPVAGRHRPGRVRGRLHRR